MGIPFLIYNLLQASIGQLFWIPLIKCMRAARSLGFIRSSKTFLATVFPPISAALY